MPNFRAVVATSGQPTCSATWAYTVLVELAVANERVCWPTAPMSPSSLWIWQVPACLPASTLQLGIWYT